MKHTDFNETKINGFDVTILRGTIAAIEETPELGAVRFASSSKWIDDRRVTTSIQNFWAGGAEHSRPQPHRIGTDLPAEIMGTDEGPSPLELALAALTSCVTTTIAAHASANGIRLESVDARVNGDLDMRGVLELSDDVRKGYSQLALLVAVRAHLPDDELRAFVQGALESSPVLDLFRNETRVSTELR